MKSCLFSTFISSEWKWKHVVVACEIRTYGCRLFMVHDSAPCLFEEHIYIYTSHIYCKLTWHILRLYLYIIHLSRNMYIWLYIIYIYVEPGTVLLIPSPGLYIHLVLWVFSFFVTWQGIQSTATVLFGRPGFGEMERDSLLLGVGSIDQSTMFAGYDSKWDVGSRWLLMCPAFWCWNGSGEYHRLVTSKAKRMIGVECLADI